ncbi:heparinase II/III family protein [Catenovulum sp. 2E275]|uniref:heparinase II/III domain-containing protein n=1 Tax=Catenovulum sp. 2E275 TaxID=2980497 RepID=UPI0021D3CE69|nr:heparinase II/III family protein [Catenovulum sp. 2E275]MCU4674020.1 heparinase II/III family protein [Catenovulum sp. 2E275]
MKTCKLNQFLLLSLAFSSANLAYVAPAYAQLQNVIERQQLQQHPNLVNSFADIVSMRNAINHPGRFQTAFLNRQATVDKALEQPINVPFPKDAGGGYTHEVHKNNYRLMYEAGILFQITQQAKYAEFVKNILFEYAKLYPKLDLHPEVKSNNPGKLFWQGLNEAVWLVHTIQAYDYVYEFLSVDDRQIIEQGVLEPVALFLSEQSPQTFDKIHNHGTWATCAVGMTGYVLNKPDWVEKALYGLDKSGTGGFMRQLDELFSPNGYYNEGPYYQRYALMPFVTFAKAIQNNQPERQIFEYRDQILLKAINTTAQLSYNGLFFPINDAIKSKGIDTIELVHGIAIAYGISGDTGLLDIAKQQDKVILTGDGLKVASALDKELQTDYQFVTQAFGDGADGTEGAFVVLRSDSRNTASVATIKATSQGLGHGHFDKLGLSFYDKGAEILTDYGAARFLNVVAKFGGRYLPENDSYAQQTIAHNTLVVDQSSHFNGNTKVGNQHHPKVNLFANTENVKLVSASIDTAYSGIKLARTIALVTVADENIDWVVDLFKVTSLKQHQFDLAYHYDGDFIESNFKYKPNTEQLKPLGDNNGYQHLWLTAKGQPELNQPISQLTWLNQNGRFYTLSTVNHKNLEFLFTQTGANDPNFNLREDKAFIFRVNGQSAHQFVSILEAHGEYNPSKEFTLNSKSSIQSIRYEQQNNINLIYVKREDMSEFVIAYQNQLTKPQPFEINGKQYMLNHSAELFKIN